MSDRIYLSGSVFAGTPAGRKPEGLQTVLEHTKGHDALTFVGLPFEKTESFTMWRSSAGRQDLGACPEAEYSKLWGIL